MHAIKTLLTLSALALSASSYVLNHGHSLERDVVVSRRHAHHGVNIAAREPVANSSVPNPLFSRAHRRSMRQKRCLASGSSSSSSSSTDNNSQTTTTDSNPATTTSTGDNGSGNTGGSSGSSSGSSGGDTFTGEVTYYDVGLGACGYTSVQTDYIAAASRLLYDGFEGYNGGNPNNNPICGRQAVLTYQGKTVTVTIVDRCEACAMYDLDLSHSAFSSIGDMGQGRLYGATWHWA